MYYKKGRYTYSKDQVHQQQHGQHPLQPLSKMDWLNRGRELVASSPFLPISAERETFHYEAIGGMPSVWKTPLPSAEEVARLALLDDPCRLVTQTASSAASAHEEVAVTVDAWDQPSIVERRNDAFDTCTEPTEPTSKAPKSGLNPCLIQLNKHLSTMSSALGGMSAEETDKARQRFLAFYQGVPDTSAFAAEYAEWRDSRLQLSSELPDRVDDAKVMMFMIYGTLSQDLVSFRNTHLTICSQVH